MIFVYILIGIAVVWLGGLTFLRRVWFYRDPAVRPDREEPGVIVAPASGQVVYIKKIEGGELFAEKLGEQIPLPEIVGFDQPEKQGSDIAAGIVGFAAYYVPRLPYYALKGILEN